MKNMNKNNVTPAMTPEPKAGSSIADLLFLAHAYEDMEDYNVANALYDRAATSCCGMLDYGRFLLKAPELGSLNKQDRVRKAERMLVYVAENGNEEEMSNACLILADFYRHTKIVRSFGYYMRAKRYGGNIDPGLQEQLLRKISKMEISEVESDPYGCYIVGHEFFSLGINSTTLKWTMYFLEIVVQSKYKSLAGLAAMLMADLYEDYCHDNNMSAYYKQIAAKNGNPEVLTRRV